LKREEAIKKRDEMRYCIDQLGDRFTRNAKVQKGSTPLEDSHKLIEELHCVVSEYKDLLKDLNRLDFVNIEKGGMLLNDILADREALAVEKDVLENFHKALSVDYSKYSTSEIEYVNSIEIDVVKRMIDELTNRYNELNLEFNKMKWRVEFS
jgi:hypothetical protein